VVHGGAIARVDGGVVRSLVPIADIPIAFGGHATYNIENALAATAVAHALGIPEDAIIRALRGFTSGSVDNPGRGNLARIGDVALLIDFAHNPAAIRSVLALAQDLVRDHGGALHVSIGMPGDRTDADVSAVADAIAAGKPARVIVREMPPALHRGRPPGDMPALIAKHLARAGVAADAVETVATESAAMIHALAGAAAGDLVVLLAHVDPTVDALLVARGATFA
jgi:cyanophycin synthetase